jgi:hypothetical protein
MVVSLSDGRFGISCYRDKAQAHDYILNTTRDNIQLLFNAIWQQPAQVWAGPSHVYSSAADPTIGPHAQTQV